MLADLKRLIELQDIESRAAVASKAIAEAPGRIAALDALLESATATLAALATLLAAVGLYGVVLQLEMSQILFLSLWQWGMASTIGALMGYAFYRAIRRSGVFQ